LIISIQPMTKLAFLFPGQGSQSVGMLSAWGDNAAVAQVLAQANEALGEDLAGLIANGPAEQLNLTVNTQPAMLAAAYAAYSAWLAGGGKVPAVAAGHSLGEYTAWVAAGSLGLSDALQTVRVRGAAMQSAVPVGVGAMAAILGLESAKVRQACEAISTADAVVEAVNYNDPNQTVIAGHVAGVAAGIEACKAAGAKRGLNLPVSAPFHSSLMRPVAAPLTAQLERIVMSAPQFAVINNVDVAQLNEPAEIKDALVRQSFGAVRWVETIQAMHTMGINTFIECGPGKALAGMVKRIVPDAVVHNVFDQASLEAALAATKE
jgi:[acyl-carrier-protein] S-malonyltransferase